MAIDDVGVTLEAAEEGQAVLGPGYGTAPAFGNGKAPSSGGGGGAVAFSGAFANCPVAIAFIVVASLSLAISTTHFRQCLQPR